MEEYKKNIANNLAMLRKKYNYKQSDIAEKLNYSDKTISKWETGEVLPSIDNLIELCKLYNITLDQIVNPINSDEITVQYDKSTQRNKLIISLLAVSAVWIIATIVFVYAKLLSNSNLWIAFVWSVPASMVVAIVFNSLWGNKKANYVFISILTWTFIASIYLQFLQYNLISLFFLGIPLQVAILLWSGIKKKDRYLK